MRICIAGTRGIPASYGGFETFAEELSRRLVERGHQVTVYCRERFDGRQYLGVDLVYLPAVRHKYFETLSHALLSTLHLLRYRQDVALYCNGANAIFTLLPKLFGIPVALNVDGLERKRKKWNRLARAWYRVSEWLSTVLPNRIITDASQIQRYYQQQYGAPSVFIPYGAEVGPTPGQGVLNKLGLEARRYFLYVSRFEPENNALLVRQEFEKIETDCRLALIGDAPYAAEYIKQVRDTLDERIILPGAIYGDGYRELQSHSIAYIHATEVGGTHPALIEAMGRGAVTLYLNTPENEEVAGGAGIPFTANNLADRMREVLDMNEADREEWRGKAMNRVKERYSWEAVTDAYEQLLGKLCRPPR